MLKKSTNNEEIIINVRSIKKVDNVKFLFEDGGQLFSSNLKDTVKTIIEEIQNEKK